jgi:hypothetical protein
MPEAKARPRDASERPRSGPETASPALESLGLLTINALVTAEAQYFALQGAKQALEVVNLARLPATRAPAQAPGPTLSNPARSNSVTCAAHGSRRPCERSSLSSPCGSR